MVCSPQIVLLSIAQGEYVASEKIETVYSKASSVGQIFVYGDSLHAYLVAVIVPDEGFCKVLTLTTLSIATEHNF